METSNARSASQCYSVFPAAEDALYIVAGKWRMRIMIVLMEGNMRFNELQRKLPGISARVLSNELKELELNGLVCKMTINGHPPTFEYGRTEYAGSLHEVMRALVTWGVQHRNKIRNREI